MNDKQLTRVNQFLSKELFQHMNDVAIFQHEDGSYEFFNKYLVSKDPFGYKVTSKYGSQMHVFSALKFATAWCIFDNRNKHAQAKRLEYLDQMLSGSEVSIEMHKNLLRKAKDTENKLIYAAKLSEDQNKKKRMLAEIQAFIKESNILQTQKFANKR